MQEIKKNKKFPICNTKQKRSYLKNEKWQEI